ncbi:MAG: hypothetical protein E7293_09110 [Lachnospiraceae bacterium]|nr:hypothetical protein [Lachnospiraceae bacterium]
MDTLYFEKTGNIVKVRQGKSVYEIKRHTDEKINLDTWRIYSGEINNVSIWRGTDIEGPIKQTGTVDFIGGCHGDERYTQVNILLDGKVVGEQQDVSLTEGTCVVIFVKSDVYFCNNTEQVAFRRCKRLEFRERKLIVSNKWTYVGYETFDVECFTGCGLYSVYKDLLVGYSTDYDSELVNDRGSELRPEIKTAYFYGENFVITLRMLTGKGKHYLGQVHDFAKESRPRFKAYLFGVGRGTGKYLMEQGEELSASFEIEII